MRDLLTIVGIIIFLVILVSLISNFVRFNTELELEGLENNVTTTPSPTVPADVAKKIQNEVEKINNLLNIPTNKPYYEDIISNLSDYYDNLILLSIINAEKTKSGYNLQNIAQYKLIKDALNDSFDFVKTN